MYKKLNNILPKILENS